MKTNAFKRIAVQTTNAKQAKEGIRSGLRKRATVNLIAAVLWAQSAISDLLAGLSQYRLGFPLSDAEKKSAKIDLGFMLRALVVIAKITKVKVPSAQRKIKVTGTVLSNLLTLELAIAALFKNITRLTMGSPFPTDLSGIAAEVATAIDAVYALSWSLLGIPVSEVMDAHVENIRPHYPEAIFAPPAPRPPPGPPLTEEQKAAKLAKAAADKVVRDAARVVRDAARAQAKADKAAAKAAAAPADAVVGASTVTIAPATTA